MRLITYAIPAILTYISLSAGWVQFRDKFEANELFYVCDTVERAEQVMTAAEMMNKIAIIWVVFDVNLEPYFKLYLEYILELTKKSDTVHIILEATPRDTEFLPTVLKHVPQKSLFIMIHDSDYRIDLCLLSIARKYLGQDRAVIFHLNHERPWMHQEQIGMRASLGHCLTEDLTAVYPTYEYVFRNYYYSDYLNSTEYVPLLSLQPRMLKTYRNTNGVKPSSQRSHWCRFAGRVNYDNMYEVKSHFHRERNQFLDLLLADGAEVMGDSGSSAGGRGVDRRCTALYDVAGHDGHKLAYDEYIEFLADTVFAPCPAGNSPETFRHYEVRI
jgi:hypothetical protein